MMHPCGSATGGQFVHTLQIIDVATGWSERIATLGHSYLVLGDGFERILKCVPFAVCEMAPNRQPYLFRLAIRVTKGYLRFTIHVLHIYILTS